LGLVGGGSGHRTVCLITVVGVGAANVTASYGGLTCALDVVARRNTRLVGAVTVEARELNGIQAVYANLDGRMAKGRATMQAAGVGAAI
jgi:hypothetical protein